MKNLLIAIIIIVTVSVSVYGAYWVMKKVSYVLFYEDMVQATVRDMVKKEALKP